MDKQSHEMQKEDPVASSAVQPKGLPIRIWRLLKGFTSHMQPVGLLLLGYALVMLAGCTILSFSFSRQNAVSFLDNLFTSTSAVSTTGLATKSVVDDYSFFGQLVILLMIQVGGIGYMSIASFVVLGQGRKLSLSNLHLLKTDFHLPESFDVEPFVRNVVIFSLIIELLGAAILLPAFLNLGIAKGVWFSIFHAVSAFCTAGFGLFNDSFESYKGNALVNIVIAILSYCGAMGFIVFTDIWDCCRGKKTRITYTSEIILKFTVFLSLSGTILFLVTEPSVASLPNEQRLLASFFQTMTAMTTVGFNTLPIGALSHCALFMIIILMVVGASPSGTGGGIKSTTITAVYAQMMSVLKGKREVVFGGKAIPIHRLNAAIANFTFYISFLCVGIYFLLLTEPFPIHQVIFEAASALGTVGLSTGITGSLTPLGKLIAIFLMFAGRVGPLSVGAALFHEKGKQLQDEDLAI